MSRWLVCNWVPIGHAKTTLPSTVFQRAINPGVPMGPVGSSAYRAGTQQLRKLLVVCTSKAVQRLNSPSTIEEYWKHMWNNFDWLVVIFWLRPPCRALIMPREQQAQALALLRLPPCISLGAVWACILLHGTRGPVFHHSAAKGKAQRSVAQDDGSSAANSASDNSWFWPSPRTSASAATISSVQCTLSRVRGIGKLVPVCFSWPFAESNAGTRSHNPSLASLFFLWFILPLQHVGWRVSCPDGSIAPFCLCTFPPGTWKNPTLCFCPSIFRRISKSRALSWLFIAELISASCSCQLPSGRVSCNGQNFSEHVAAAKVVGLIPHIGAGSFPLLFPV